MRGTEFSYRIPGRPGGRRPGMHRSRSEGPGLSFTRHVRLFDQPDPRRIDLSASLKDARGEWLVRATRQPSATTIECIVDVSASMRVGERQGKLAVAADFVESLGYSAFRGGDAVGLLAFDNSVRDDLRQPPRSGRGVGLMLSQLLRGCAAEPPPAMQARGADIGVHRGAALDCASQVSAATTLVFVVSDFHWPLAQVGRMLASLRQAHVVPLVIWDALETTPPEANGWLRVRDVESGGSRSLVLGERTRQRWRAAVARRRADIDEAFGDADIRPHYVEHGFDPERLTRHFLETVA